jgi:hypothetical protein
MSKIAKVKKAQVVEHLPSKVRPRVQIPVPSKKKKKEETV